MKKNNTSINIKLTGKNLIYIITVIILLNLISSNLFFRLDLTGDKRFTLAEPTKEILDSLNDVVYIKVYLEGEIPIGFSKLKKSIKETLDEFKVYGKRYIEYEFINPYENKDQEDRDALFRELYKKGLQPTNIQIKNDEGGTSQKLVFPGALVSYKNAETGINLLSNNPGLPAEVNLNNSIQSLEYRFISLIRNITSEKIEKVAFIEGHGELNEFETGDITKALANYYQVDRGIINGKEGILDDYKAVIIAKPQRPFSEKDKYVLDQYIMNGGKVLWFIDAVNVNTDSLLYGQTLALINDINIDDQLFRYGVRVNPVLVKDMQANYIPVNTAVAGSPQPKWTPVPWPYFPLLLGKENHPVTRNLNMIKSEYISSIDTLDVENVEEQVVLETSSASGNLVVPAFISLDEINNKPKENEYNADAQPVAVILEGEFTSVFKNRMLKTILGYDPADYKEKSKPTKMMVVADGDIIRNEVTYSPRGNMISPLGYDRYTNHTFGNKEFVLNAVNFLVDDAGIIDLRSREYKLRLLDKEKLHESKLKWQLINIVLPLLIIFLFGLGNHYFRKKRYQQL